VASRSITTVANALFDGVDASTAGSRWLVINPHSGRRSHVARVRRLANERGYVIRRTETAEEAARLAARAADAGVSVFAVCGGDGTVHTAVNGLDRADALDDMTLGVVPAGTGNGFAASLGIYSIERGFDAIDSGTTRRVPLHRAGPWLFCNGCTAGLNDDTEAGPPSWLKGLAGRFAYRLGGAVRAATANGTRIEVEYVADESGSWSGRALCVLVGRPSSVVRRTDHTATDGAFDVAIVERDSLHRVVAQLAAHRRLGRDTDAITTFTAHHLEIRGLESDPLTFCSDGELYARTRLSMQPGSALLSVRAPKARESRQPRPARQANTVD